MMRCFPSLLVLVLLVFVSPCGAQSVQWLEFGTAKVSVASAELYVANIVDARKDTTIVASYKDAQGKVCKLRCKNGLKGAIYAHLSDNAPKPGRWPLTLKLLKIQPKVVRKGTHTEVSITTCFGFYYQDNRLVDINVSGESKACPDVDRYISNFILESLEEDWKGVTGWWQKNKEQVPTDTVVHVTVSLGTKSEHPDQMVYRADRLLTLDDFGGIPDKQSAMYAMTYSALGFNFSSHIAHSRVEVELKIIPYFESNHSWCKAEGHTPKILAHEQLHFDIRALEACKLVEKVKHTVFTKTDYAARLEQLRAESAAASAAMQDQYDAETAHGTIPDKQQEWQDKVARMMADAGCYR